METKEHREGLARVIGAVSYAAVHGYLTLHTAAAKAYAQAALTAALTIRLLRPLLCENSLCLPHL
jgi:hypothetical protein